MSRMPSTTAVNYACGSWDELVDEFITWLRVERGLSPRTIGAYSSDLAHYKRFLSGRSVSRPDDVNSALLLDFLAARSKAGSSPSSTGRLVAVLRSFHRFLLKEGLALTHPAAELRSPRKTRKLPQVLSLDEVELLISRAGGVSPRELRSRALLELLYSS